MDHYEIRSMSAMRGKHESVSFDEALYGTLKAAPWWLASAGAHGVLFLALTLLVGEGAAPPAKADGFQISNSEAPMDLEEPEIPPEVDPIPPLDQPEKVFDMLVEENLPDNPVEDPPEDPSTKLGDPRFQSDVDMEGLGENTGIGVGGDRGGMFGNRPGGGRTRNLRMFGDAGDDVMHSGLRWLRAHQSRDGSWDGDGFESMCKGNRCGGPGGPLYDPGLTGLSLLAFLGAGETHKSTKHGTVVRAGLKYLMSVQDAEGCFGPRTSNHFTYNHAIAALAMAEAYGLTQSPLFKARAQNGIDFISQCQNPYLAWRYGVKPQDNDTSVTGWMVMALKSAKGAGLDVDPGSFEGAKAWLDKVTEPEYGRAGYTARGNGPARPQELMDRFPADRSESLTAVAVLVRVFCGAETTDEYVRKGADLCLKNLPSWDEAGGTIDLYYWYYGSLAMFQVGGKHWEAWKKAMVPAIVDTQRRDPTDCRLGSWDPVDPWGPEGGRVYRPALNTMALPGYSRYPTGCGATSPRRPRARAPARDRGMRHNPLDGSGLCDSCGGRGGGTGKSRIPRTPGAGFR